MTKILLKFTSTEVVKGGLGAPTFFQKSYSPSTLQDIWFPKKPRRSNPFLIEISLLTTPQILIEQDFILLPLRDLGSLRHVFAS